MTPQGKHLVIGGLAAAAIGTGGVLGYEHFYGGKAANPGASSGSGSGAGITNVTLGVQEASIRGLMAVRHMRLRGRRVSAFATQTLSGVSSVSPKYGQTVTATVDIRNAGQLSGEWGLDGSTQLSGTTLSAPLSFATKTGTLAGNASTTVTLVSTSVGYGNKVSGYSASAGLDLVLFLQNMSTKAYVQYVVPGAIFLPVESPASFVITGVTV